MDGLVVTHLDRMDILDKWQYCSGYRTSANPSLVSDFFDVGSGRIRNIKVPPDPTDLAKQEALTSFLFTMRPVYSACQKDEKAYLQLISQALGTPALYTSHGPTALDKEFYPYALNPLSDMVPERIGQFPAPTCR
jgi:adenylosuccinate synthase